MFKNRPTIIETAEEVLGYKFREKKLLLEAISHPSLNRFKNNEFNYERLEFLGDSVLNLIVTEAIVLQLNLKEGILAKVRSYMVSKDVLSEIAQKLQIGDILIMSRGEEMMGGRKNINNLEDALEAIIAAIYLDSGIKAARKWVLNIWQDYIEHYYNNIDYIDPKSKLQEWTQSQKIKNPEYKVISIKTDKQNNQLFETSLHICGKEYLGRGKNKKSAEKDTARIALEDIDTSYLKD